LILDLRPYVQADLDRGVIQEWDSAQYRALFTRQGAQFGVPKYHGALALYYNKELFDRYHIEYPSERWTYDDYRRVMRVLARDRDRDGEVDLWGSMFEMAWDRLNAHVNAWGGHFVDPRDDRKSAMAEPAALQAMEWIRTRMWTDHCMTAPLNVENRGTREAFIAGQSAMIEDGSCSLKAILSQASFPVGIAPMPLGLAGRASLATSDGYAIYAGTRYPEAAWELVKYLVSLDYGRAMATTLFLQPARASLLDEWMGAIRAEFPEKTREIDLRVFADGHLNGTSVVAEVFANQADAMRLAKSTWQQVFTLGQAQSDLIRTLSKQIDQVQLAAN
jgi:multiple sugar transport system substrate-binding protein